MFCKITPLSHGQHNNLHLVVKIGRSARNPIIKLKIVGFFDSLNAYIINSNLHIDYQNLLNFDLITEIIQKKLETMDFNLICSQEDFFNRNLSTLELLNKLKDENKCTISSIRAEEFCVQSFN
jgi:hypothetical protein